MRGLRRLMPGGRLVLDCPAFDSIRASGVHLPMSWQRFSQRSTVRDVEPGQALAAALGLNRQPGAAWLSALAVGAVEKSDSGRAGRWVRFDPVDLTPDLTAVWLRGRSGAGPWASQDSDLRTELGRMFDAAGMDVDMYDDRAFGLVQLDTPSDCLFVDLDTATGRRLDEVLPIGADAPRWRQLINESQMIFHQFRPMNQPDQSGRGLWFWGSDGVPDRPEDAGEIRFFVPQQSAVLRGLASWLDAEVRADAAASFADVGPGTTVVRIGRNENAFDGGLADAAGKWLEPAWRALKRGRLAGIDVCSHDRIHSAGRLSPFSFWRRDPGNSAGSEPA